MLIHRLLPVAVAFALLAVVPSLGAATPARPAAHAGRRHRVGASSTGKLNAGASRHGSGNTHHSDPRPARRGHPRRREQHPHKAKRHRRRRAKALVRRPTVAPPAGGATTAAPPAGGATTATPTASGASAGTPSQSPPPPTGTAPPTTGGTTPESQLPPSPECTQTVSSTASAASALAATTTEATICLKAGAYGPLDLAGAHSNDVTIEPVPGSSASVEGVSIAASSSGITIHNFSISGGVSLAAGDSHITIDHNDIDGQGPGGDGEGVETLAVNCTAPNAPTYPGCESTAPDTYITINGNEIHGYGEGNTEDAIHLNDWEHVTITANDIYDLEEHGSHTDAMQSVFGGHYMTFAYNYEHDNQSQGFFISDGDSSEVTVTENLFLRNDNEPVLYPEGEYNIQVFDTTGLTIANNTVWDGQADILRAEGAAEPLTANVNHNVEQALEVLDEGGPEYSLSEDYDIFKEDPFTFSMGPHSKVEANPDFVDPAADDYELASNPDGIGVDWQPSEYVYGPTGD